MTGPSDQAVRITLVASERADRGRRRTRTRTLARHPVFGTGVCTTQTSPSVRTRDGNRTRACASRERRPWPLDHASKVPLAGLEPARRASETRVTSTCRGAYRATRRGACSQTRVPPAGLEPACSALGPRCRFRCDLEGGARHGASGGNRTRVSRFAGACLTTWRPMQGSGARIRTSIAGAKTRRPSIWTTPERSSRHSGSNRAFSHTRRACRAAVTVTAESEGCVEGIEPISTRATISRATTTLHTPRVVSRGGVEPPSSAYHATARPLC